MTTAKNDERNWVVAVLANGWTLVAKTFQAENQAREFAERLALSKVGWDETDLDTKPTGGVDEVLVYERKGAVRLEQVAKWL